LISFTRFSATLNPTQRPQWQYLHNADFTIVDPQEELAGSIVDNPALDPFVDSFCAPDTTQEALGNSLRYNGRFGTRDTLIWQELGRGVGIIDTETSLLLL
jgi:hypothetical protein